MNYKLIMLDNPILVSDEKIKEGDFYFKYDRILQWVKETSVTYTHIHPSNYPKPIIAGLPDLPKLNLSLISDEIGWVDVEKLAYQAAEKSFKRGINKWENKGIVKFFIDTYIEGFKAAQSLNERKYTLADMKACWEKAEECVSGTDDFPMGGNTFKYPSFEEYISSLSQIKEYSVEVEMNTWSKNDRDGQIAPTTPKVTNDTIRVIKINESRNNL